MNQGLFSKIFRERSNFIRQRSIIAVNHAANIENKWLFTKKITIQSPI